MNKQQKQLIKNTVLCLKEAHKTKDTHMLNYCCNVLDGFNNLKDFDIIIDYYFKYYKV